MTVGGNGRPEHPGNLAQVSGAARPRGDVSENLERDHAVETVSGERQFVSADLEKLNSERLLLGKASRNLERAGADIDSGHREPPTSQRQHDPSSTATNIQNDSSCHRLQATSPNAVRPDRANRAYCRICSGSSNQSRTRPASSPRSHRRIATLPARPRPLTIGPIAAAPGITSNTRIQHRQVHPRPHHSTPQADRPAHIRRRGRRLTRDAQPPLNARD